MALIDFLIELIEAEGFKAFQTDDLRWKAQKPGYGLIDLGPAPTDRSEAMRWKRDLKAHGII